MIRRSSPIGWPRRDPRHYRFAIPNAVWEYHLKPAEFAIFSYLCYHRSTSELTLKEIAAGIYMTTSTVKKYLDSLIAKKLIGEDGTPALKSKDKKFSLCLTRCFCCGSHPLRLWSMPICC